MAAQPPPRLARCPVKGCAQRYRTGPDRLCPGHEREQAAPGEATARELMDAPGARVKVSPVSSRPGGG